MELDGVKYPVGGLVGQPVHNYLDPQWLAKMTSDAGAFVLVGIETGKTLGAVPVEEAPGMDAARLCLGRRRACR